MIIKIYESNYVREINLDLARSIDYKLDKNGLVYEVQIFFTPEHVSVITGAGAQAVYDAVGRRNRPTIILGAPR